jgi:hypothetical protein
MTFEAPRHGAGSAPGEKWGGTGTAKGKRGEDGARGRAKSRQATMPLWVATLIVVAL